MKSICLLGSTGSIGVNALDVIGSRPKAYRVTALGAGRNIERLCSQIEAFSPKAVAVQEERHACEIERRYASSMEISCFWGQEGFARIATLPEVTTVISAMSGASGLLPSFRAVQAGKDVALANKETMVMAGPLVMEEVRRNGGTLLPIDSEHSAILQAMQGHSREDIRRVILTASGGPFRDASIEEMARATPSQALRHPNWAMGPKVTIDSATLMNKGLECIEARWLFHLEMETLSILIHPQSIVHSMVEYRDGSFIAQMAIPDMRIPIAYALSFPRHEGMTLPPLDLEEAGPLRFLKPDMGKFPCLRLALEAAAVGGTMPCVLNRANEVAVEAFLSGRLGLREIATLVEKTMEAHNTTPIRTLEEVLDADRWAREAASEILLASFPN